MLLEDYLETSFNTVCEDGSPDEIGELLVTMWRQCGEGDFTLVTNTLAREFVRHETLQRCQGINESGDAMDSGDEDDVDGMIDDDGDEIGVLARSVLGEDGAAMDEQTDGTLLPPQPPLVDPDGWETVARGKAKTGRRKG